MNLVNVALAFGAGVLSITSPCCLPLLPGYIGYLTGLSREDAARHRARAATTALLFVVGFGLVFVALGATASELGAILVAYRLPAVRLAGLFILAMGLILLLEGRVGWMSRSGNWNRRWARGQTWAALPLGMAFAITWTPCIGPVLGAILTLAGSTADLGRGVVLLMFYTLGLGLPFFGLGVLLPRLHGRVRKAAKSIAVLQAASGVFLVAMGALLLTDRWLPLVSPVLAWYAQARWPPI